LVGRAEWLYLYLNLDDRHFAVTATNNGLAANLVRLGLIVTLCPSTNSWSRKPCWKDFRNLANVRGEPLLSHPIIGIGDCCARAANGHATAVLTTNAMNSGRFMCFPRARATLGCQEYSISDRGICVESHAKLGDFSCLLGVKSGHRIRSVSCPLYPQKRTSKLTFGIVAPATSQE
jgi:hypothetical protein